MSWRFRAALIAAIICTSTAAFGQGSLLPLPPEQPARGMTFPSISPDGKTICFTYLGDLWTVPASGGRATRLTVNQAQSAYSRWSPDGNWIAFASDRYGSSSAPGKWALNYDVFVIPAVGGEPRRITHYTGNDYPSDWSPDGTKILFQGIRDRTSWQAYSIDVKTGVVHTLTTDPEEIRFATYSPDGGSIAYVRSGDTAMWWRPRYHGSANMDVYTKSLATGKISRVTDYDGMDVWPMYSRDGRQLCYVSDRLTAGTPNIVCQSVNGGRPELVTRCRGGAVRWPCMARNGGRIAYEYEGDLYTVDPAGGQPTKVTIYAPSDEKQNNITPLELRNGATEVEISPDGKTLALVARGELWTVPAEGGGDARRLTDNPANDFDIVWSPDGKQMAFASDRKGNFDIYTIDLATREVKPVSIDVNDENSPRWSPDGKSVSFLRSGAQAGLYVAPADGSAPARRVAESYGNNLNFDGINSYSWSPDGKWLAFSRRDPVQTLDIWIVPASGGKETNVTYYPGMNILPDWTPDGKYLVFLSNRDRGPGGTDLYAVPLQREPEDADQAKANGKPGPPAASNGPAAVKIDWQDIEDRAIRITSQGAGPYAITRDSARVIFASPAAGNTEYFAVSIKGGATQRLTNTGDVSDQPKLPDRGPAFFYLADGGTVKAVPMGGGPALAVPFAARFDLDRSAEIHQAFNEFWRRVKVGFYDPTMHGVDWNAIRAEYEPLLSSVGSKEDFWYLLSEMVGELNASHSEVSPAPGRPGPADAELGITFDESYAGPGLKVVGYMPDGPDDDLGPRTKPGEYILQIDGEDVSWNEEHYDALLGKAGKSVELLVNSKPSKEGARAVKLKPITFGEWADLEYERKVKERRAAVEKLSGGRLAYIHIKGMDQPSLHKLERELWGRARVAEGLVLDIRDNGGGNTHDVILSELSRPVYGYTQVRDGQRSTQPYRHWGKPIILLINQDSASDAEIFPNGFRALKLGKIVGMPTPGYVIGTFDSTLQDGTGYRIPTQGYYDLEGRDMENRGVKPDITVELTPDDIANHRDRQLEVAVETLMKELPKKQAEAGR